MAKRLYFLNSGWRRPRSSGAIGEIRHPMLGNRANLAAAATHRPANPFDLRHNMEITR